MSEATNEASRPKPARKATLDETTLHKLEKAIQERPDKVELVEKNILKDDRVAPALQAAKDKLERSQLEDKIAQALSHRPQAEELVKEGILQPDEVPDASS